GLLVMLEHHLAALDGAQFPALIVFADFEPDRRFGGRVDKDPKAFPFTSDSADQRQLRALDARRFWWWRGLRRRRCGRDRRWRWPARRREQRPLARGRQHRE